ncbi:TPR-like protein [Ceratobasidium sp. AG-I]|nr:TPR-like protein [Ceratobasidium sp. AG-I]
MSEAKDQDDTKAYLRLVETTQRLDLASEATDIGTKTIATTETDGQAPTPVDRIFSSLNNCPPPTPVFTGREKEISQINSCFFDGALERRIFVLHGLGGAGKTQTALRFVEATQDKFSDIIYVDATSHETISASLKSFAIAKSLGKSPEDTTQWLSSRQDRWLLIFDNADDPEIDLHTYFPKSTHGNILITTRNRDLGLLTFGDSATCEISGMEPREALQLLQKTAQIQDDSLSTGEKEAASELLKEFGYFALAIIQAGAYIQQVGCGLSLYRELYHRQRQALLEEYKTMSIKIDDYQKTVYTTWVMSFERLGARAVDMLQLLAFLHNDGILEDMFRRTAANILDYTPVIPLDETETAVHVWLKEFLAAFTLDGDRWNSQAFRATMAELAKYSLISYDRLNCTYSVHPLVHLWARTTPSNVTHSLERTARLLALSVNYARGADDYGFRRTLGPHLDEIFRQQPQPNVNNLARYAAVYQETGRLKEAETMNRRLVDEAKRVLGENSPGVLVASANLAHMQGELGHWEESAKMMSKVVEQMKQTLGEEEPVTLLSMSDLATSYKSLGRLSEAEALQLKVFEVAQKATTPEHGHLILISVSNLGEIYLAQGPWEDAERIEADVLTVRREEFGEEHPETLESMNKLALIYAKQHRWDEAKEMQTKVLAVRRRTLGELHPNTLTAMHGLADTLSSVGEHELAADLNTRLLAASRDLLGEKHPDTLSAWSSMASDFWAQGRWAEAEPIFQEVYVGRKETLGDNHPHTLSAMNNLAAAYSKLGRHEEARVLQEDVLALRQQLLGEEHPDTLTSMNVLALIYLSLGELGKAEPLQLKVLDARRRILGPEHPSTLISMHTLARIYNIQGRLEEFAHQESQWVEATKRTRGATDMGVMVSTDELIATYLELGALPKAQALQVQQVQALGELLGVSHPSTLDCMRELAATYKLQGLQSELDELNLSICVLEILSASDSDSE